MAITQDMLHADRILYAACKATLWAFMEQHGIAIITVSFNGSGDSGIFEDYADLTFADLSTPSEKYTYVRDAMAHTPIGAIVGTQIEEGEQSLQDLVVLMASWIEDSADHGVDWWNNDGGQGKVEFILDGHGNDGRYYRRGIHMLVQQRIESYDDHDFSIEGEVDEPAEVSSPE